MKDRISLRFELSLQSCRAEKDTLKEMPCDLVSQIRTAVSKISKLSETSSSVLSYSEKLMVSVRKKASLASEIGIPWHFWSTNNKSQLKNCN